MQVSKDVLTGMIFILVALATGLVAYGYGLGTPVDLGPGAFPFFVSGVVAICGVLVILQRDDGQEPVRLDIHHRRPLFFVMGSVLLFAVGLPWLGLLIAIPILVFFSAFARPRPNLPRVALSAVFLTVLAWVIFVRLLSLPLPLAPKFWG